MSTQTTPETAGTAPRRWVTDALTGQSRRGTSHETRQEIARRYEAGETCAEIAPNVDLHPNTVRNILLSLGVQMRPPGRRPRANH